MRIIDDRRVAERDGGGTSRSQAEVVDQVAVLADHADGRVDELGPQAGR